MSETTEMNDTIGTTGTPLLEARDLHRTYNVTRGMFGAKAEVKAVAGISFSLNAGETLAIVGESGSGKSTLGRMLTLIETPTEGHLRIDGVDVSTGGTHKKSLRSAVQLVFQNPYGSLNPRQTIGAALEEPLLVNTSTPAAERRAAALAMLERVGLRREHADRYPHMFSGGQRQRIAIARALMLRPKILVLDEPVSALDVSVRAQILNLISDSAKGIPTRLRLHQPRSVGGSPHLRSRAGHVSRPCRGIWHGGRGVFQAVAPLYACPDVGDAGRRSAAGEGAHRPERRNAVAVLATVRLRLSSALPVGVRSLLAEAAGGEWSALASGRVFCRRGVMVSCRRAALTDRCRRPRSRHRPQSTGR